MSSARTQAMRRRASDGSEPGRVVGSVEAKLWPLSKVGNRAKATELHREADRLYYRGDYESALVLYHRAAHLCPRESLHMVSARRTEAAINSSAKPPRELLYAKRGPLSSTMASKAKMSKIAMKKTRHQLANSTDALHKAYKDLDLIEINEQDLWPGESVTRGTSSTSLSTSNKSRRMLRQLDRCVRATYRELEAAYGSGDTETVHKLGDELVNLVSLSEEPRQNQVEAYRYLAMKQVALGRHDRALELASKMLFLAKSGTNDIELVVRALTTLGKVHLSFGHVNALVREWERLVDDIKSEPMAQAWLYHEIGRCHLQLGNLEPAVHSANLSLERATSCPTSATCKWLLRAELLRGEALVRLGRPYQALDAFKSAEAAADPQREPQRLVNHVRNLIKKLTRLLDDTSCDSPSIVVEPIDLSMLRKTEGDGEQQEDQGDAEPNNSIGSDEQLPTRKRHVEDSQVARILQRTKELGRLVNPSSAAASDDHLALDENSSIDEDSQQEKQPDTGRTRIISRLHQSESEDERTFYPDELLPLNDPETLQSHRSDDDDDNVNDRVEEDFRDAESDSRDGESLASDRGNILLLSSDGNLKKVVFF
ncbi:hypothetical protein QAD02_001631 [Eretmocerus hayati]|uniref:Uncharacterized protein n=1 Tax=Eretmocerus hayati TaxID=131215 RepID=A0ACC2NGY9_9HYME|nr:hypothetical protein QAD02_001631 [Eretmocerus hayati]